MGQKILGISVAISFVLVAALVFTLSVHTDTSYVPQSIKQGLVPMGHITLTVFDPNGNVKVYRQTDNKIVDNGLKESIDQLFGSQLIATSSTTTGATVKYLSVGTGTNAAAAGDTTLQIQRLQRNSNG